MYVNEIDIRKSTKEKNWKVNKTKTVKIITILDILRILDVFKQKKREVKCF